MSALIADIVILFIVLAALLGACYYIYREKKQGRQCIGCPSSATCQRCNNGKPAGGCKNV